MTEAGTSAASRLTATGAPFEFCFAEGASGLRYTVEYGPPGEQPERRLSDILGFLTRQGVQPPRGDVLDRIAALQRLGGLTYGAWLGVRHHDACDRFKVYAEVPAEAAPAAEAWTTEVLGKPPRLPGPTPRVNMIGLDADSNRFEIYLASRDLLRTGVSMALLPAGLSEMAGGILSAIDGMTPFAPRARLPARDIGFSYAVSAGRTEVTFTLYLVARKLFGDDRGCADWIGDRLPEHARLMRILPLASPGIVHHGMIGLTVGPGLARPLLTVGVAAPWMN
ncbi:hypothetical protein [Azospirillum lipoferum]|uniref:Uncharacterized protein n=1 Tax=Azospirillum lipoferum (strain 4B) TaxID=862719 RepID=G7ZHU0_AZOL4|nr:hypothetical protein [Azospirillum lipoferum]CBS91124.1 Protein of unknown function [Azospirillum lipoferum 4B]